MTDLRIALERLPRFGIVGGQLAPHHRGTVIRLDDALRLATSDSEEALSGVARDLDVTLASALQAWLDAPSGSAEGEDTEDALIDAAREWLDSAVAVPLDAIDPERLARAIGRVTRGPCDSPAKHHNAVCGHPYFVTDNGFVDAIAAAYRDAKP